MRSVHNKLTNSVALFIITLMAVLLFNTCKQKPTEPPVSPPPPAVPTLTLKLDDAHCTEAWIKFTSTKLQSTAGGPYSIILKQFNPNGDSISKTINLMTPDTLLYIDSLLPKKYYRFKAEAFANNKVYTTNELTAQTMDTTSHNFTFEMFTFGQHSSSTLYDVAIINENNIIAVGGIFMKDSLGNPDQQGYGIVKWNGERWELKKLFYNNNLIVAPIRGILVLSTNDIYLAAGSVFRWDGVSSSVQMVYSRLSLPNPNGTIEKLWASTNSNIYGVGNVGSLVHYNGTSWRRIESNTTLNINDIWGDYNEKTKEWEILAVGGNILAGFENSLIKIHPGNSTKRLNTNGAEWPLRSVWFYTGRNYYIAGSGIYQKHLLNDNIWKNDIFFITTYSVNRIRANEINDIVATGGAGELLHFNGYSWKSLIDEVGIPGNYYSTDINENTMICVGQSSNQAVITIGKR